MLQCVDTVLNAGVTMLHSGVTVLTVVSKYTTYVSQCSKVVLHIPLC
jgi:hypothetical protein